MTNLNKILIFGAGFLTGALLFGGYIKEKYEAEAQEEIDAMKEYMDETIAKMGEDLQRDLEHFQDKIEQEAPERKDRVDYVQVASRYDTGGLDIDGDIIEPIQADEEASKVYQEETGEDPYIIDRDTFYHTTRTTRKLQSPIMQEMIFSQMMRRMLSPMSNWWLVVMPSHPLDRTRMTPRWYLFAMNY